MCLYPQKIRNPDDYTRNHGYPFIYVKCGKCIECYEDKSREWQYRLYLESKNSLMSYFCTLTYDDVHLHFQDYKHIPVVSTKDVQDFIKRFRNFFTAKTIRYFAITEYGETDLRPHAHILIFCNDPDKLMKVPEFVEKSWSNGFVDVRPVSDGFVCYVSRFHIWKNVRPKGLQTEYYPKLLCSRNPFIGGVYALSSDNVRKLQANDKTLGQIHQHYFPLSRSIKNKVFDEETRKRHFQYYLDNSSTTFPASFEEICEREDEIYKRRGIFGPSKKMTKIYKNFILPNRLKK